MTSSSPKSQPPPEQPLAGRQRRLVRALEFGVALAAIVAVGAMALPGAVGESLAQLFVAILIATPLLRVAWLVTRWMNRRDFRFAVVGLAVLAVALIAGISGW